MTTAVLNDVWMVRAAEAATAWLNAAIASSQDKTRGVLYRTVCLEFFPSGIQFVATNGHILLRTWAPRTDIGDLPAEMPEHWEQPDDTVVVMDVEKFVLGFMRTLAAACTDDPVDMTFTIEPDEDPEAPALGEEVARYVLTLHALGQTLSCKLFDERYPNWRVVQHMLGLAERVDGLVLATKLFAAVGKLKGVVGIEWTFTGDEKAIQIRSSFGVPVRGLLMPMRRPEEKKKQEKDAGQLEHEE